LRTRIAKEKDLPSYIVFNDKTLHDMCSLLPQSDDDFLMVYGVGQSKLENYGADFMSIIRQYI
jgi:ATP-dependent DNA helicase RecQ